MEALSWVMQILTSTGGAFATVFVVLISVIFCVHWVTKKVTEMNVRHQDRISKFDKVDDTIDEIRRDIVYIKGNIDLLKNSDLAKSHSPLSLTEKGKEFAKDLNAEVLVNENWSRIHDDLEKNICDKNAYDIQQYCIEIAAVEPSRFFCDDDLTKIKQFAFDTGKTLQYYSIIFALIIRDRYFAEKAINLEEVDKCDPINNNRLHK